MTTALIDGDVLRYEVGSISQNEEVPMSFDYASQVLDNKIEQIMAAAKCTDATVYLTGANNFRDAIAVTKPYKGNRKGEKPWHFDNLTVYLKNQYDVVVAEGMEADDLMSVRQYQNWVSGELDTVICTRDKDLRMIPGLHYGWECGQQREYFLREVTEVGGLDFDEMTGKLTGVGMAFFWAQMLIGDTVDNIPGCPGIGPKKAWELLKDIIEPDFYPDVVLDTYRKKKAPDEYILEQGQLLWMTRELTPEGKPVLWQLPY